MGIHISKKVKETKNWFLAHVTDGESAYQLDNDQAAIVTDAHKNTLVTARAGSGKTRTVVAKIIYLIAHQGVPPASIVVFAFNRKARAEINERLAQIKVDGRNIFTETPRIATTFHAFAYQILGGKKVVGQQLISEAEERQLLRQIITRQLDKPLKLPELIKQIDYAKLFILRAEQKYFKDYAKLDRKIKDYKDPDIKKSLEFANRTLKNYHYFLEKRGKTNFNLMMVAAAQQLNSDHASQKYCHYQYVFIDEYQDFSLLFLNLVQALLGLNPAAHLLTVGDDWQAINRFAGSDVDYFLHFSKYFPEDATKLFISTNYRSGKQIVENANFFMSKALKDYQGCKSGNRKVRGHVQAIDVSKVEFLPQQPDDRQIAQALKIDEYQPPLLLCQYAKLITQIVQQHPGQSIKILHRNNDLSYIDYSLDNFVEIVRGLLAEQGIMPPDQAAELITCSTIHRSKGLEADVVILLEIDAKKFPEAHRETGFQIFGDTRSVTMQDQHRLFYVAITRAREQLYILTKSTKVAKKDQKLCFLSYLNDELVEQE